MRLWQPDIYLRYSEQRRAKSAQLGIRRIHSKSKRNRLRMCGKLLQSPAIMTFISTRALLLRESLAQSRWRVPAQRPDVCAPQDAAGRSKAGRTGTNRQAQWVEQPYKAHLRTEKPHGTHDVCLPRKLDRMQGLSRDGESNGP